MKAIKGPAVFLAQFAGDAPPFNTLPAIAGWAAGLGFKGVQIPTWDRRLFDLERAADSQTYCDEVKGTLAERGLQVTELSTHLQGQLVAVHPAYDTASTDSRRRRSAGSRRRVPRGRWSRSSWRRGRRAASASPSMRRSRARWRGRIS